jgi:hypothetical protein
MPDLQIAMRDPKMDGIRATGAFAVLTLRAIEKIRAGRITASEAARYFEQVAHAHGLRETGHYDPKLVDMLIVRLWQTRKEEGRTWGEERESDFVKVFGRRPATRREPATGSAGRRPKICREGNRGGRCEVEQQRPMGI